MRHLTFRSTLQHFLERLIQRNTYGGSCRGQWRFLWWILIIEQSFDWGRRHVGHATKHASSSHQREDAIGQEQLFVLDTMTWSVFHELVWSFSRTKCLVGKEKKKKRKTLVTPAQLHGECVWSRLNWNLVFCPLSLQSFFSRTCVVCISKRISYLYFEWLLNTYVLYPSK